MHQDTERQLQQWERTMCPWLNTHLTSTDVAIGEDKQSVK